MNCSHQIWAAERLGGTSSVQTNLKVTNDTIMQLSCEFGKTTQFHVNSGPAGIYLLKVNKRNTRTRCGICSKLTIKIPERRH